MRCTQMRYKHWKKKKRILDFGGAKTAGHQFARVNSERVCYLPGGRRIAETNICVAFILDREQRVYTYNMKICAWCTPGKPKAKKEEIEFQYLHPPSRTYIQCDIFRSPQREIIDLALYTQQFRTRFMVCSRRKHTFTTILQQNTYLYIYCNWKTFDKNHTHTHTHQLPI